MGAATRASSSTARAAGPTARGLPWRIRPSRPGRRPGAASVVSVAVIDTPRSGVLPGEAIAWLKATEHALAF